jgi:hypothetical protein
MKKIINVNDSIYKKIDIRKKIGNIKSNQIFKCNNILNKIILLIINLTLISIIFSKHILINKKNPIYTPILPSTNDEYIVKKYNISYYNTNQSRYNFQSSYKERKIFKINYSYLPYIHINKSLTYEENAEIIYNSTGMLNITKFDYYFNKIDLDTKNLNHIHLTMGLDNNYVDVSLICIASILNTSSPDTYIHLHIMSHNFRYKDMEKIIQLKRINNKIDFVFYCPKQAEYDFEKKIKNYFRGVGDYSRILAPEIVNNTNKVLILDSGDIIVQKDISEVYYYDIGDNYFSWIIEEPAGNPKAWNKFFINNLYPNTGVCLVNVRLFRKDNLYKKAFFLAIAYDYLPLPYQDIFSLIPVEKVKIMPLKYNCKVFFQTDKEMINKDTNAKLIKIWLAYQRFNPFKYTIDEILDAALDPVIVHFYHHKITNGYFCNKIAFQFIRYSKLTGYYKEIKRKYPRIFIRCERFIKDN